MWDGKDRRKGIMIEPEGVRKLHEEMCGSCLKHDNVSRWVKGLTALMVGSGGLLIVIFGFILSLNTAIAEITTYVKASVPDIQNRVASLEERGLRNEKFIGGVESFIKMCQDKDHNN